MPKTFTQFLDTTTLPPNLYNEEINARKHFEMVLECIDDVIVDMRKALNEPDAAKQELRVLKNLGKLSHFTNNASRVFYEYRDDTLDIVEEN